MNKTCPFCGGLPTMKRSKMKYCQLHGEPYQDYIFGCFKAHCDVKPQVISNLESDCFNKWNKREDN